MFTPVSIKVDGLSGAALSSCLDSARWNQSAVVSKCSDGTLTAPRKLANLSLQQCHDMTLDVGNVFGTLEFTRCTNVKVVLRPGSVLRTVMLDMCDGMELELVTYDLPFRKDVEPELRLQSRSLWTLLLSHTKRISVHTNTCDAVPPSVAASEEGKAPEPSVTARTTTALPDFDGVASSESAAEPTSAEDSKDAAAEGGAGAGAAPVAGGGGTTADEEEEKKPVRLVVYWDFSADKMEMKETKDMFMAGR